MRALAAEPGRRYPSAEQLLTDVRNHLQGLPVVARGDSLGYRSSKFVRRHRAGVAAAALVLLSLVGGLSAALWQADQAARERDHADRERVRAEQVSGFVLSLFEAADPLAENRGDSLRVSDLVDRGAERVRRELAGQPQLQAQMLTTLGRVYSNLGSFGAARSLLDEALSLAGGAAGAEYERARALAGLAEVAERLGEYVVSDTLYRNVLALYASYRWEPEALFVSSVSQRAIAAGMLGRSEEAVAGHEEAIRLVRTLPDERGKMYSAVINNLAVHFAGVGEHARAEPLLREVVEVERELYGPTHPHLAVDFNNLASAIHYQGRHAEAEPYYRQAVEVGRAAYGSDHPTVAQFLENLATLLDDGGRHREAEPFYREALRIQLAALGPSSPRVPVLRRNLALNRHSLGEYEEAEALLREAIRAFRAELGADHLYTGLAMASLGRTLTAAGRPAEARPLLEAALALLEAALPEGHWRVHAVRGEIGAAIAALGDTSGAEPMLLASYDALVELKGEIDYSTVDARRHLHRFYTDRGMRERAATFRPRPR
jgi:serine/threonine-protein kinase